MQCLTASRDLYYVYKDDNIGQSGRGFPLNDTFREFLIDMRDSRKSVLSPTDLFKSIVRKNNRFRGYQVNFNNLNALATRCTRFTDVIVRKS